LKKNTLLPSLVIRRHYKENTGWGGGSIKPAFNLLRKHTIRELEFKKGQGIQYRIV
jgi:hypothetical protein